MSQENLEYERFVSGEGSYEEVIDFLCEDPGTMKEAIQRYDEDLGKAGFEINAHIRLRDLNRAFNFEEVLSDQIDRKLARLLSTEYLESKANELSLMIEEELDWVKERCDDILLDHLEEEKRNHIFTGDSKINLMFNRKYEDAVEIDSEYENINFYIPTPEGIIDRIKGNFDRYIELRENHHYPIG